MWSFCLLIVKWRDVTLVSWHRKKLAPPPLGNPGSATVTVYIRGLPGHPWFTPHPLPRISDKYLLLEVHNSICLNTNDNMVMNGSPKLKYLNAAMILYALFCRNTFHSLSQLLHPVNLSCWGMWWPPASFWCWCGCFFPSRILFVDRPLFLLPRDCFGFLFGLNIASVYEPTKIVQVNKHACSSKDLTTQHSC